MSGLVLQPSPRAIVSIAFCGCFEQIFIFFFTRSALYRFLNYNIAFIHIIRLFYTYADPDTTHD